MKKNIYFFTRLLIIFTPLCLAMENNTISTIQKAEILQIITAVKNPISTFYLNNNNEVIIIGVNKLVVYDTDTNKITTILAEYEKEHVSTMTSINQQKNKLAVRHSGYLRIYEIPQGNILWQGEAQQCYNQPVFNSNDDTLFMFNNNHNLIAIKYKAQISITLLDQEFTHSGIRFHNIVPHQNITDLLCISYQHIAKICCNPPTYLYKFSQNKKQINQSACNKNGNIIVFNCIDNSVNIVNTTLKTEKTLIEANKLTTMAMKFIPNSDILATITNQSKKINFWNAHTHKLIATILLDKLCNINETSLRFNNNYTELMNISPDGTKLILTDLQQCYIIKIPFDAQYLPDTQQKCILTFCLLNRINILPQDVIRYLVYNLFIAHKYSLTTY